MTSHNTTTELSDLQTDVQNKQVPEGCFEIRLSEMEFVPWNNPDNIVSEETEIYSRKVRFGMLQLLFLIGGPANVINMAVFFKQGLKDRVNLLLFSLSLADELFLVTSMLTYGEEFYRQLTEEKQRGPMIVFMINNRLVGFIRFSFVSFVLSAIVACERCYCVLRPLKYQTLLRTRTMAVIILAVNAVVLGLAFVVVSRYHFACVYDPGTRAVTILLSHSEFYISHKDLVDSVDSIFFGAGLPPCVMIVVVTATAVTTSRLRQAVAWRTETSSSLSPREVALTKMLIGTSVLLLICITPVCLFRIACLFLPEMNAGRRNQNLYLSCLWLTEVFLYVNSSSNIFVYYLMGSRYRETFWALLKRKAAQKEEK